MKITLKTSTKFVSLSFLISIFVMITLPSASAINSTTTDKTGEEENPIKPIKNDQAQSVVDKGNDVIKFSEQSSNLGEYKTGKSPTKIMMEIDGLDHSTEKVEAWFTTHDGKVVSKTFNPIPLLNSEDDNEGLVQIPMQIDKGLMYLGDTYTGCIKVMEDTDDFGNKQSCQQSVLELDSDQEQHLTSPPSETNDNDVPKMKISL